MRVDNLTLRAYFFLKIILFIFFKEYSLVSEFISLVVIFIEGLIILSDFYRSFAFLHIFFNIILLFYDISFKGFLFLNQDYFCLDYMRSNIGRYILVF
jgi:hypothetical protein